MSLHVLHVASELFPYAKTGGLADAVAALALAERAMGLDARVLIPGYPSVLDAGRGFTVCWKQSDLFGGGPARVYAGKLDACELPVYVLDCPGHFMRAGGLYAREGDDWPDNHLRFGALGWVARQLGQGVDRKFPCDIVHAHDWQASLAVAYLSLAGARQGRVTTIHNIAYAGAFDLSAATALALPSEILSIEGVEFYGRLSFLKAGLYFAHKITTVSPTYAREIQSEQQGGGFHGLLRDRAADLVGVLNGVDYAQWNPATDIHLTAHYDASSLGDKANIKRALRTELGLTDQAGPLLGVVSRFAWQKGIDLILPLMPWFREQGFQIAVLGAGDPELARHFQAAAQLAPDQVALRIGYDEGLAHRILAGSDALLVPSRSEPCGLTQLYALRYGTLPIVRRTGGLADTVRDVDTDSNGTGFVFDDATPDGLRAAIARAAGRFLDQQRWADLQKDAMRQDFAWQRTAQEMARLYAQLPIRGPRTRPRTARASRGVRRTAH